jgi:hypothetical protein
LILEALFEQSVPESQVGQFVGVITDLVVAEIALTFEPLIRSKRCPVEAKKAYQIGKLLKSRDLLLRV